MGWPRKIDKQMNQKKPSSFSIDLAEVEKNFHLLINDKAKPFIGTRTLELPPLTERFEGERYFAVDGMHGGFSYRFKEESDSAKLLVKSWSRIVEDSTLLHEVSSSGYVEGT